MPRKTQIKRAEELGVSRDVLQNARAAGVNIWSDEEFAAWRKTVRPRMPSKVAKKAGKIATAAKGKVSAKKAARKRAEVVVQPELPGVTIEELAQQVKEADTYEGVKILNEKLAALQKATNIQKLDRDLIPMKEAKEAVIRIVSGLKGRLLKVPSDTAPRVEGLAAAKAEKVIREEMLKALEDLAEDGDRIFQNA